MVETPSLIREKHQKGHRKKKQIRNEERENPERNTVEFHERFIVLVSRRAFLTVMAGSLILPLILGLSMHRFLRKEAGLASSGGENASRRSPLPPSYTFEHFDTHTEVRSSSVSFSSEGEINFVIDQEKLSCRHILFDLEKIDPHFLDSEQSLTRAARTLGQHAEKSVSYDVCHRRSSGVDCVVSFGDGRLSLSTWPSQGVMAADLFACDQKADLNFFLPIVPIMEELFGIPSSPSESAHMIWGQRSRGFRHAGEEKYNPEDVDLEQIVESRYIEKTRVHSVQTKFQRIDIWDLIEKKYRSLESYVRSLSDDGSYESLHPEFFKKDRLIFLDNILQSRTYGEAAYHEPLVHPVMLAHNNPRRVAIIGGGEGATLREVLKHKTVENVIMIEIDEVMVNTSRIYLPEWSDCTNLVGSTPSCFDDPRADVHYEDAIAWFVDNFADEEDYDDEDLFDIIIMDAL
jgi:spermidine synthase